MMVIGQSPQSSNSPDLTSALRQADVCYHRGYDTSLSHKTIFHKTLSRRRSSAAHARRGRRRRALSGTAGAADHSIPGGRQQRRGGAARCARAQRAVGQQVFVDNRAGAGGVLGTEAAASAPADGYTLLIVSIAHAANPALYKLNYDPIKSFAPVSILASGPNVLAVNPRVPVNSVAELIALAKQKPGTLEYASAGVGSFQHLGGELFKVMAGVNLLHVPYKGGGPSMSDVISGHVGIVFSSLIQTSPFIES